MASQRLWFLLGISVLVALFSLFNNYPGFLYTDSFIRWDQAESIVDGKYIGGNFLTIAPSLLFSLVLYATGNPAAYSFLQAALLCFVFLILIVIAGGRKHTLLSVSFALILYVSTPQFIAYGLTHAPGVGVAISMVGISVVLVASREIKLTFLNVVLLLTLLAFICFGFRQNALVLLPVFIGIVWLYSDFSNYKKVLITCILIATAVFAFSLPSIMNWKTSNQLAKSIAWEMACLVKETDDELFTRDLSVIGVSDKAIHSVHCANVLSLDGPRLKTKEDISAVYKLYAKFIIKAPAAFAKNKFRVWSRVLGFTGPLEVTQVVNEWPKLADYGGYKKTERRSTFVNFYHSYHDYVPVFRYPYILMGLALFLLAMAYSRGGASKHVKLAAILFFVATTYYGSFFIVAQRHELRYFFPSAYVYFIVIGMSLNIIFRSINFSKIHQKIQSKRIFSKRVSDHALSVTLAVPVIWVLNVSLMPRINTFFMSSSFSVQAASLTDANWIGGIALGGADDVILIEATPENIAYLRLLDHEYTLSAGGVKRVVKDVRMSEQWIHLVVTGGELDPDLWGYPNNITISR